MAKKYSFRFWLAFWAIAFLFLSGFYYFLESRRIAPSATDPGGTGGKIGALTGMVRYFLESDSEKVFLVLFQNNMEIRPGGGFIGAFGILKMKNGRISEFQSHDTGNFDGRIPDTAKPPYPMAETLRIKSWKLRDSNFSPDFPTNADKALEFYRLGQGGEKFDGVIAITTNVLTSFLKVTGPIELPGYPGEYKDEDAVLALEYQVEQDFWKQGIATGERKTILSDLGKAILKKTAELSLSEQMKLAGIALEDLNRKDIQLLFFDENLQDKVRKAGWDGRVDREWSGDYLMAVDANLGAYKSDYRMRRSMDYSVDLSDENPKAVLKIAYAHTGKEKDYMTRDYLSYLRVYVPEGAWLERSENFDGARFGEELGKKYFGAIVKVPLNSARTVTLEYFLPKSLAENYSLKIQKQAGINDVPVATHVTYPDGSKKDFSYSMNSNIVLNE